ncbi:MAG TPA: lytic transglycosylase domain-containing protein [Spirochaetota bacterium]|nr:lytic transglycosylase domain-containing protein [Spirochaetota bacterium]HOL56883.1 lytic transglycosylase domain-containing protein [Spirochaetota bacterium]HPP04293.1 lytic transglycosylase domain-containing protein [Spirochaetota bacterium]
MTDFKKNRIPHHYYYKPDKWKKIKKIKNILLFALYLASVIIIVNLTNGNRLRNVYANNKSFYYFSDNISDKEFISSLNFQDKLKIKFLEEYIGNKEIAYFSYKYSKLNNIEPELLVAIMKVESNFNPKAINYNRNGTIDRGLCQLNNVVFSNLTLKDFFDIETNIKYGSQFIKWCLDQSQNNLIKALAMYNAGVGNVLNTKVGERTLNYIEKIINEKEDIKIGIENYLNENRDLLN